MAVTKRLVLVSLLGLLIVAGGAGLAVVLGQTHARSEAQLREAAEDRAALGAALINSVFATSYGPAATTRGALAGPRVTSDEIRAAGGNSPLTAIFDQRGALLASHPALASATRRLISSQPAVAAALRDGHNHLSSLLEATAGTSPGFLDVTPFHTRYGMRVTATWVALPAVRAVLDRYLGYVANYTGRDHRAQVFLLDANDAVIGSAGGGRPGARLDDAALRTALAEQVSGSRFGAGGSRFFAAARLGVAPWTVVYTTRTASLFASQGRTWRVSLLLLAGFLAVAAVCLALLIGLLASFDKLARANGALGLRNDQLRRATDAKSRFVANMAHELRTPLSAVIGFSELIRMGRAGPVTATQTEYLGIVRSSADHLLLLINEALDLATVESGQMKLSPEAFEPSLIARQSVSALRALADARDLEMTLELEDLDPVSLDPGRLRQVILNLVSNAIKFSHPGGRVTVRVAREGERLTIAVTDEGIGIEAADQQRVFDEFVQLGERAQAGSGLGLAVTRRIVRAQGGEVSVRSQPGAGSTFTVWLPWVVADAPTTRAQAGGNWSRASRSRPRIPSSQRSG